MNVGGGGSRDALDTLLATMMTDPSGRTPLCGHLQYVHDQIVAQAGALQQHGQKAVLVIATDGVSTDGDLAEMMRRFEHLPVWVVVRLCTDEDEIIEYWNNVDNDIEVDMDVLDDFVGEAKEVAGCNRWLNYGLPLHRAREWGVHKKAFDLLDERLLTATEMRALVSDVVGEWVHEGGRAGGLVGGGGQALPHPTEDFPQFEEALRIQLSRCGVVRNPLTKRAEPWVDMSRLGRLYDPKRQGGCCAVS